MKEKKYRTDNWEFLQHGLIVANLILTVISIVIILVWVNPDKWIVAGLIFSVIQIASVIIVGKMVYRERIPNRDNPPPRHQRYLYNEALFLWEALNLVLMWFAIFGTSFLS